MHSFKNWSKCKATKLSKFEWECKFAGSMPSSHWKSVCRTSLYIHKNDHCNLCLMEKLYILTAYCKITLNTKSN